MAQFGELLESQPARCLEVEVHAGVPRMVVWNADENNGNAHLAGDWQARVLSRNVHENDRVAHCGSLKTSQTLWALIIGHKQHVIVDLASRCGDSTNELHDHCHVQFGPERHHNPENLSALAGKCTGARVRLEIEALHRFLDPAPGLGRDAALATHDIRPVSYT